MPALTPEEFDELLRCPTFNRKNSRPEVVAVLRALNDHPDGLSLAQVISLVFNVPVEKAYSSDTPRYNAWVQWFKRRLEEPGGWIQLVDGATRRFRLVPRGGDPLDGVQQQPAGADSEPTGVAESNGAEGLPSQGTAQLAAAAGLVDLGVPFGDPSAAGGSGLTSAAPGVTSGGAGAALALNEMRKKAFTVHKSANSTATVLIPTEEFVREHRIDKNYADNLTLAVNALSTSGLQDDTGHSPVSTIAGGRTIVNWDALDSPANVKKIQAMKDEDGGAALRVAKKDLDRVVDFGHVCAEAIMREEGNGGWFDGEPSTSGRGEFHAHSFLFNPAGTPDQPPHWDVRKVLQFIVILTMFATPTKVTTATEADVLSYDESIEWLQKHEPGWQPGDNWNDLDHDTREKMVRMAVHNVRLSRAAAAAALEPVISAKFCVVGTCVKVDPLVFHAGAAAAKRGRGRWVLFFTYAPPGVAERYTGSVQWNPWNAAVYLGALNAYLFIVREYASEQPWRFNNPYPAGSEAATKWEEAVATWARWPQLVARAEVEWSKYAKALRAWEARAAKRRKGAKAPDAPEEPTIPRPPAEAAAREAAVAVLVSSMEGYAQEEYALFEAGGGCLAELPEEVLA